MFLGLIITTSVILLLIMLVLLIAWLLIKQTIQPQKRPYDHDYALRPEDFGLIEQQHFCELRLAPEDKPDIVLHGFCLFPGHNIRSPSKSPWWFNAQSQFRLRPGANTFEFLSWQAGSGRIIVLSHMFRRSKQKLFGLAISLYRLGYGVMLYDFRAHGQSSQSLNGMAQDKIADLQAQLTWLEKHYPQCQIILMGVSLGAAVSLKLAAKPDSAKRITAVIADSPYVNMLAVLRYHFRRKYTLPPYPWLNLALWLIHRYKKIDLQDDLLSIAPAIAANKIPVLLIHGRQDHVIPYWLAEALLQRLHPMAEFWQFDGGHYAAYFHEPLLYLERVSDFLQKHCR